MIFFHRREAKRAEVSQRMTLRNLHTLFFSFSYLINSFIYTVRISAKPLFTPILCGEKLIYFNLYTSVPANKKHPKP
jgi:hypothetical protein